MTVPAAPPGTDPAMAQGLEVVDDLVLLDGVGALLAGTANVIMQVALPAVGYGVVESRVESGQVMRHPLKRFRTTFTYLAVALLGSEDERARYREAVNGAHRLVRSDAVPTACPVAYNAFDRDLQLWVAACLYYGSVDVQQRLYGPLPEKVADEFYRYAARFGTTLQVDPARWPADRAAFTDYWREMTARVSIDEPVRLYLRQLMWRRYLPAPLRLGARFDAWVTTGFLPEPFRSQMQLTWTDADEARFSRLMSLIGAARSRLPRAARRVLFTAMMIDLRRRIRTGRPLV